MIKRLTSVALVCVLLSVFLVVPARAALLDGTASIVMAFTRSTPAADGWSSSTTYDVTYSSAALTKVGGYQHSTTSAYYRGAGQLSVPLSDVADKVIVACSYFLYGDPSYNTFYSAGDLTPVTSWTDANSNTQTGSGSSLTFTVTGDPFTGSAYSTGVTISGTFEGTEASPVSDLVISWSPQFCYGIIKKNGTQNVAVSSFRVIGTDASSAVIAGLEDIARGIAEMNDTLSAMYGDILAICNAIYERTGDLLTAQQLTNEYFKSIIPLISSISSTTSNIYTLLGQQFSLLISTIQSESDDIQATINAAIDKMIAYLDNAFSSSINPALPGQSTDISGGSTTVGDAESGYQSTASERFENISANFAGFDGSVLSGVALAGTLFQRLWNVLGDYVVVYTVPLVVAICLTILGRADRRSKKDEGSAGGGDGRNTPDGLGGIPRLPGK